MLRQLIRSYIEVPARIAMRFAFPEWLVNLCISAFLIFPALSLVFFLLLAIDDAPMQVPALSDAQRFVGVLHFTQGARNWRSAELKGEDGAARPVDCKRFLQNAACFTLDQGEQFEGRSAVIWWHPIAKTLQVDIDSTTVIDYRDTIARLSAPRPLWVLELHAAYFVFLAVLLPIVQVAQGRKARS